MGKRVRRIMGMILVMAMICSAFPVSYAMTTGKEQYDIVYTVPQKGTFYTQSLDEAFLAAHRTPGVKIVVLRDREIDFPSYLEYGCLNENTILTVGYGATITVNQYNFQMNGRMIIQGKLDLEHSEGIMYGTGTIDMVSQAQYVKRSYDFVKKGDICLEAKDICYSQNLSEATITTDKVNWVPSIEGTWRFLDEGYVPQAGTRCHDVVFIPKYPMTYENKIFEKGGKVTTKQSVPKCSHYEKPQIYAGENLLEVRPEVTFVDPITEEIVEGEFSFEQSSQTMYSVGTQEVLGEFKPKDANYATVKQYFKIEVLETKPVIMEIPQIRNQGTYGQTLGDISYLQGKCMNPYTNKSIDGTWEWRNPSERLTLGNHSYTMLFLPKEEGYQKVEFEIPVNTLPKVMENITWPVCSDIMYGQALSASSLSFTKNEYGTFAWKNENIRPEVKNQGAAVVFTPARTDTYDWSRLAGYDEDTKTITFTIPIQVNEIKGELPVVQASEISEGACVSGSALSLQGMQGNLEWKSPEQVADKSDWYEVYYTPKDVDNYDWSAYSPGEDGKITMSVYLTVIPKPTKVLLEPQPTAAPTEPTISSDTSVYGKVNPSTDSTYVITQLVSRVSAITNHTKVKQISINRVKCVGKKAKISWKRIPGAKYLVQYSTSRKMKKAKKISAKKTMVTLKGLKKGKKYYVRVRAWKKISGKKVYGKWCKIKKVVL